MAYVQHLSDAQSQYHEKRYDDCEKSLSKFLAGAKADAGALPYAHECQRLAKSLRENNLPTMAGPETPIDSDTREQASIGEAADKLYFDCRDKFFAKADDLTKKLDLPQRVKDDAEAAGFLVFTKEERRVIAMSRLAQILWHGCSVSFKVDAKGVHPESVRVGLEISQNT